MNHTDNNVQIERDADTQAIDFWSYEVEELITQKFPNVSILDLSNPNIKTKLLTLESISYANSGYGENTEGEEYFERINQYKHPERLIHLGIWDNLHENLLYYMDIYPLQPQEEIFDKEFYSRLQDKKEEYLNLPGLVFNKIMRHPDFKDSNWTPGQVQITLVIELMNYSPLAQAIRIEERCQPDSFNKIMSRFISGGYFEVLLDEEDHSKAQVTVHQMLIRINPTEKVQRAIKFMGLSK